MSQAGQDMKHGVEQRLAAVKAAHDATGTERHGQIAVLMQKPIRRLEAATDFQGDGQHLSVTDPARGVFPMPQCVQQVIAHALHEYNTAVHRRSPLAL